MVSFAAARNHITLLLAIIGIAAVLSIPVIFPNGTLGKLILGTDTDTQPAEQPQQLQLSDAQMQTVEHSNQQLQAAIQQKAADTALTEQESGIAIAKQALLNRESLLADLFPEQADRLTSQIEQQHSNLDAAENLLSIAANDDLTKLEKGVRLAKRATKHQTQTLGFAWQETVSVPEHQRPSDAIRTLAARHNAAIPPETEDKLAALDALDEPIRSELTDVLNAYLAFSDAAQRVSVNADIEKLRERENRTNQTNQSARQMLQQLQDAGFSPESLQEPGGLLHEAGVDLSPVFAARNRLLDEVKDFAQVSADADLPDLIVPVTSNQLCNWVAAPAKAVPETRLVSYGVDSSHTQRRITDVKDCVPAGGGNGSNGGDGGGFQPRPGGIGLLSIDLRQHDTTYEKDWGLLIDVGGDDVYDNNAGGGDGGSLLENPPQPTAAALIDLNGNDRYRGGGGNNGGGHLGGSGFLFDLAGNDEYTGSHGTNGGGNVGGSGFLLDISGHDRYYAGGSGSGLFRGGTNGGGDGGAGMLIDLIGNDTYRSKGGGSNGGAALGSGVLIDYLGGDVYDARNTNLGRNPSGTNGGAIAGSGFLLDVWEKDSYHAESDGTNGGAGIGSVGFLLDAGGRDTYDARSNGANGGSRAPFLTTYDLDKPLPGGVGLLLDLGEPDTYVAGKRGANGGAHASQGDVALLPAFGLLIDAYSSGDSYRDNQWSGILGMYQGETDCTDCTRTMKGVIGTQIDVDDVEIPPHCGDGTCGNSPGEETYCEPDCNVTPTPGYCGDDNCGNSPSEKQYCRPDCRCIKPAGETICPPFCDADGTCEEGEDQYTCPTDCS